MSSTLRDFYYGKLETLESGAEKIPAYREVERKKKSQEKIGETPYRQAERNL